MAKADGLSTLRKIILLMILAAVALGSYLSRVRSTDWIEPLWVTVYPINGDDSAETDSYINQLEQADFLDVENFIQREASRFSVGNADPLFMKLRMPIDERPPEPPASRNLLSIMWWSLRLRVWANGVERKDPEPGGDIRIFVLYYDPTVHITLRHSLGLQKGLIGVVHAFARADLNPQNNVVIAHELLHTLGATDKYQDGNYPVFPQGFADPDKQPLLPQTHAEIMGGRIPKTEDQAEIPPSLRNVVVGPTTAKEINWIQ
ncbi:MAG: hypothetical protein AAF438_01370 [Pseudomonadota bacterium]